MAITFNPYAVAVYAASIPLGFVFVGFWMWLIRWTLNTGVKRPSSKVWLDFC